MFRFTSFIIILMLITSLTGGTGFTQELIVFPAKGQVSGQYDNVNITFMSFYVEW